MATKDWAAPLIAAAVTFAGLLLLPEPGPPADLGIDDDGVDFVFAEPPRVPSPDRPATVVVVSRDAQPVEAPWRTPYLALYESTGAVAVCLRYAPCVATHEVAAPEEPRLAVGGYNATRVTVHVFDADAELVFSNGNASEQARLTRTLTPEQLPRGTWYLGANATAPPGTQQPPPAARAFLTQARTLIDGLPVGGVATTQTDALAAWYGTLYITLRVDQLVLAP
jgi:hypothetical protein